MIRINEIRNLIDEAKCEHLMGLTIHDTSPSNPHTEDLAEAIRDLVQPENQVASGTCMRTGARDVTYENDHYILEIDYPATY